MSKCKFTLIELLVVIAIIGILLSMLMPALSKARYLTRAAVCGSNIKQNAIAINAYAIDSNDRLPYKVGSSPEFNRYFYRKRNDQHFLLGDLWKKDYLSSPQTIFCPEVQVNHNGTVYSQAAYTTIEGEFSPRQGCIDEGVSAGRSNYIIYPYPFSETDWSKLFMAQLGNTEMLHADAIFNKHSGVKFNNHIFNGDANWNVMRVDGSLKFIQSSSTQAFISLNDLYNNWPDTETARDELLKKF